jgi:hypothetical protein
MRDAAPAQGAHRAWGPQGKQRAAIHGQHPVRPHRRCRFRTEPGPRCHTPVSDSICEVLDNREIGSQDSSGCKPGSCVALMAAAQAASGGRLIAKVADFGLSSALDPGCSHISKFHSVGGV